MIRVEIRLAVAEGLHARPAAELVRLCADSGEQVTIRRSDGRTASGSSMLAVLTLGLKKGDLVTIEAPDSAKTLVDNLKALLG